ncbi:GRF zinc finger domain-containing protein [Rhizodiscina lignyota]|uniref:GRF zinc finger domain-containing protein n=1 Tax=Rhizodiscina lignyota TaxID=1504668 RepID=A0A9P4IPV2_9PEZI|nr:GRF zinc finger domain-containing protein [Rhizodiscina lignyota]
MDAFISRKRQHSTTEELAENAPPKDAAPTGSQDDTDFKLAILASLWPGVGQQTLLETLLAHDGNVDAATAALVRDESPSPRKKARTTGAPGYQSSLSSFNITSTTSSGETRTIKPLTKKGRTLHLYSPTDIEQHCPCTLIHNFLPQDVANSLLRELLDESPTYTRETFQLFDNVVQSPHTICFYVDDYDEAKRQKTEYIYNGARVKDVRPSLPRMREVSVIVQEAVNREVDRRIRDFYPGGKKLKYQTEDPWAPNAAFVNCYDGGHESVGYHSDQLTYLGPRAIIGSLSLGVEREFRIRRVVPRDDETDSDADGRADAEGQIAIHLPHNSLLVMHAEMQEEWKHSIAPAQSITSHPIAGKKRINITYRHYRAHLHPKLTPRCKCGTPCVLRCVQRNKMTKGRYCWMCHVNYTPGREGCGWFEWAVFDRDGRPSWAEGFKGDGVESDDDSTSLKERGNVHNNEPKQ